MEVCSKVKFVQMNYKMNNSLHKADINNNYDESEDYETVPLYVQLHCQENRQDYGRF